MRTRRFSTSARLLAAGLLVSFAGLPASAAPPLSYQEITFTQADEWATTTERTPDGGTIAAGVALNAVTARDIMLEKLDKCGNRQWVHNYSNPFPNGQLDAHSVRVARDGHYVVAGEMRPSPIPGHEIFLMKVNSTTGAVMWANVYQGNGFTTDGQTVTRELSGAQGGWVLIGRRNAPPQGGLLGGVLITTNAVGTQTSGCVWTDSRWGPLAYTSFNDVRQNPDGSFTVVGWTRRGDAGPSELLALRTQNNSGCGPLRWSNVYLQNQPLTEEFFGEGMDIAPGVSINGQVFPPGYIFTGPWRNANNANVGSNVVRTDANGVPVWMFTTPTFWESQSVRARPHGGFVFAGREPVNAVGLSNGALMRVSNAGLITHEVRFNNTNFPNTPELAHEAIPAADGGVFAVADARNYTAGGRDFWTSKTNSLLSTVSAITTVACDERVIPTQDQRQPFTPIQMVRLDENPSSFVDVIFTPRDLLVRDLCTHTCGCTPAPSRMTLWLPFDEPAGITAANIRAPGFPGTDFNGVAHTLGVQVDNSRTFDGVNDYVDVPDYAGINPAAGAFTIDAWVNPTTTNGVRTIVDKRTTSNAVPVPSGYAFFILNGTLWTQLGNGASFGNFNSALPVAANTWTHVATVYNPVPSPTLTMYVNGVAGAPIAIPAAIAGNHSSAGFPFRVGARANPIASYFSGGIDEVEFHRAALTTADIQRVFTAGVSGKCKNACSAPVSPFCVPGQTTVVANLTICNYTTTATTYSWNLSGDGVGPGCSVVGPTTFSPSTGTTPIILPGACFTFPVTITRPAGLFGVGLTGCYTFAAQNNATGDLFSCPGKVVDNTNLCFNLPLDPNGMIAVPAPGLSVPLTLTNTGSGGQTGTLRIRAIGPDMEPDLLTISLNGLPPGQPILRSYALPAGGSQTVPFDVMFTSPDPEQLYMIVLEADTDGDGEFEPLASYRTGDTGPCVADVDDGSGTGTPDGGVTIDDLLYYLAIFEAGDIRADVDDGSGTGTLDGGVTIDDLLYYLQRFELGC